MLADVLSMGKHINYILTKLHTDAFTVYIDMHHRHHWHCTYMYLCTHEYNHNGYVYMSQLTARTEHNC